ncbi:MAG: hypothetical protein ACKPGT_33020, partial [Microcystis sp.]
AMNNSAIGPATDRTIFPYKVGEEPAEISANPLNVINNRLPPARRFPALFKVIFILFPNFSYLQWDDAAQLHNIRKLSVYHSYERVREIAVLKTTSFEQNLQRRQAPFFGM